MSFANSKILSRKVSNFQEVQLSSDGTKGIAGSDLDEGIFYTNDSGTNWLQSNITKGSFIVTLSSDGIIGFAGSLFPAITDSNYYTNNSGETWTQCNITNDNLRESSLSVTLPAIPFVPSEDKAIAKKSPIVILLRVQVAPELFV